MRCRNARERLSRINSSDWTLGPTEPGSGEAPRFASRCALPLIQNPSRGQIRTSGEESESVTRRYSKSSGAACGNLPVSTAVTRESTFRAASNVSVSASANAGTLAGSEEVPLGELPTEDVGVLLEVAELLRQSAAPQQQPDQEIAQKVVQHPSPHPVQRPQDTPILESVDRQIEADQPVGAVADPALAHLVLRCAEGDAEAR